MSDFKQDFTDDSLSQDKLNSIYRGVVEDNLDPLKAGRCRIRIFGIHTNNKSSDLTDGIPTEHLPWAHPASPIFGGISKVGIYGLPCQGAHVFVFFETGNILQPRYFATAPGIPTESADKRWGFYDPSEVFPLPRYIGDPDWNDGEFNEDKIYGNSFVIGDKAGSKIEFDSTPGNERIIIEHGKSHSRMVFYPGGGINQETGGQTSRNYSGAQDNVIGGDSSNQITGQYAITSFGSTENVMGTKKVMVSGISDEVISGISNKKTQGLSYNIEGDTAIVTSGKTSHVSSKDLTVKSLESDVKIQALLLNISMMATLGINSTSSTNSFEALLTASLKGNVITTVGGGMVTKVDSTAVTMITGGIIMIG
jgi:hypothetical protein